MAISSCIHFSVDDMDIGGQGEFHCGYVAHFLFLIITASVNPGVQVPLRHVDSRDSDLNMCTSSRAGMQLTGRALPDMH